MGAFNELLDRAAEDIEAPPLPPMGTYTFQVKGQPETSDVPGNAKNPAGWESLNFRLELLEADSVDPDLLADFGKVQGFIFNHNFMFSNDPDDTRGNELTLNALKSFIQQLGIEFESGTKLREALAQVPGCQAIVDLSHRQDKNNPDRYFVNVKGVHAI